MQNNSRYEYKKYGKWFKVDSFLYFICMKKKGLVWRAFDVCRDQNTCIYYFEKEIHRLDGPAVIVRNFQKILYEEWYVNGVFLWDFENFYKNPMPAAIFDYVKFLEKEQLIKNETSAFFKKCINSIVILSKHNKWLTENEITLLSCYNIFI